MLLLPLGPVTLIEANEPLIGPRPNIFCYQLRELTPVKAALRMVFYSTIGFIAVRARA